MRGIQIGQTKIAHGIDGRFGEATPVVEIYALKNDIHGKLFICGYRQYGENAGISFSIKEGDEFRHALTGSKPEPLPHSVAFAT